jgi:hypothetical protein
MLFPAPSALSRFSLTLGLADGSRFGLAGRSAVASDFAEIAEVAETDGAKLVVL